MADATQDDANKNPGWVGGTPTVRLSSDSLPSNPKRVIRTYASDLAALKGAPPAPPAETPAAPAKPAVTAPPAPPPPRPTPPPVAPPIVRTPPPIPKNLPGIPPVHSSVSLSDAVSGIALPNEEVSEPHIPPVQKAPMYVRKPETPAPAPMPAMRSEPSNVFSEGIVHEKKPSLLDSLLKLIFGGDEEQEPIPMLPSITPVPRVVQSSASAPPPAYAPDIEGTIGSAVPSLSSAAEARDREEVLGRLRARVSAYTPENNPSASVFPTPKPEVVRDAFRPPPPPLPRDRVEAAVPDPERLRTFSSDFSNETQRGGASAFSILAAQADAPRPFEPAAETEGSGSHRGLAYALIAAVLFIGGSLLLYFGYTYLSSKSPVAVTSSAPATVLVGDDTATISDSGSGLMNALVGATNTSLASGDIRILYVSLTDTTANGATETVTKAGGDLFVGLKTRAPSILLRNIHEDSTVGVLNAGGETRAFFILDAQSYDNTFAGMLTWEPTMGTDLAMLYPAYATQTTIGSTTPTIGAQHFVDEVVQSHDVRALKDGTGQTLLVYGYRDAATLIIARSEAAFTVLLARLAAHQ